LISGNNQSFVNQTKLFINDGSGNYSEASGTPFEPLVRPHLVFADFDNDGDEDLIITGSGPTSMFNTKVYTNDGNGSFTEVNGLPFTDFGNAYLAVADIDKDNDSDIITGGLPSDFILATKLFINTINTLSTEVFSPFVETKLLPKPIKW